ncbi:hypothetical protein K2173_023542 [Erythroxylum novogranatense]|uniref:Avr9/Cf-9 rapidly elicited protein n=1 Tax=Erythroxylum novogranatense TaxID=1862640 RepID=A0AAV8TR10_9ROSI|nr:hypothetical protein K2173_023542 [Erythroxylum novogranatense]
MEMEASSQEVAKKLWHIVRAVVFIIRNGISKSRVLVDLHKLLKRGNKLVEKAIGNLITFHIHHSSSFSCRSDDALSFVSPREYEFSCSNSPAFYSIHTHHKRKRHPLHHRFPKSYKNNDVPTVAAVQKMLEMLNKEVVVEASPLTLPGFGKSPMVRQLRITDSPFPLKDEENNGQVDKAAEDFIQKFYKNLKLQKSTLP